MASSNTSGPSADLTFRDVRQVFLEDEHGTHGIGDV